MHDILCALAFLAEPPSIIHTDCKPENVLQSTDGVWKLADFGTAFFEGKTPHTTIVQPEAFRAPESWTYNPTSGVGLTTAIDVWSTGRIFHEIFIRRHISTQLGSDFLSPPKREAFMTELSAACRHLPVEVQVQLIEFCRNALQVNPTLRFSAAALLETSLFTTPATSSRAT